MSATAPATIVLDASVVINLIHVDVLRFLGQLVGFSFVAPEEVQDEMQRPTSREAFAQAMTEDWIRVVRLEELAEYGWNLEAQQSVQKGEAACLALARSRGWHVACDEGGRYAALAEGWLGKGQMLNTLGLVLLMLRAGLVSVVDADGYLPIWAENRFRVKLRTFQDLLGG